jgi:surface carbohydrate biosynthesis protein
MKKKVDFLIRYEHKVRELESIMLLKLELERRGYTVAFVANYDYKDKKHYDPKVIVSPAIYNDGQLKTDISRYGLKKKIANLLWEQVMGIAEEESPTGPHNVYGTGQKAVTFCWGENTMRRLINVGMSTQNAKVVGQINTDLLREPFNSLLSTKEQLAEKYELDINSRWNLFVSSFAYCELDELQKNLIVKYYEKKYLEEFTKISIESRNKLLIWFEEALKRYPQDTFIYRPHPDEAAKSQVLKDLVSKYANFYVIAEMPLKHWCNAADKVYNWYSTGIIDAVVLNKPCRLLRPVFISDEYDYRLFYSANKIKTLQDFLDDYDSLDNCVGLDPQMVTDYYYFPKSFVYLEICDVLEDLLTSEKYDIHYTKEENKNFQKVYWKAVLMRNIGKLYFVKPLLRKLHLFDERFAKGDNRRKILNEGFEKNVATDEECRLLAEKLKPMVYGQEI